MSFNKESIVNHGWRGLKSWKMLFKWPAPTPSTVKERCHVLLGYCPFYRVLLWGELFIFFIPFIGEVIKESTEYESSKCAKVIY